MKTKIFDNAILRFGMGMTMRRKKSIVLVSVITLIAALIVSITFLIMNSVSNGQDDYPESAQILFVVLTALHISVISFTMAATAGTAISSEREKQTLDVLLCSQMTPWEIVFGKFLASVSWSVAVSLSLLPTYMVLVLAGGVTVIGVLIIMLFIIWWTLVVGSIAVFYSSVTKRTALAVVLTIVTIVAYITLNISFASLHMSLILSLQNYYGYYGFWTDVMPPILYINPVLCLIFLIGWTLFDIQTLSSNMVFNVTVPEVIITIVATIVFFSVMSFILLKVATNNVDPMKKKEKIKKHAKGRR